MTAENKTLRETVQEVIGERNANPNPNIDSSSTGISQSQSGDTKSGEKPEFVAGVDISDIPEQDRPRIKAKLEEKLKFLEKGYQPKFQEVAKLKKSLEWLGQQGITGEEAEEVLKKHIEGKKAPSSSDKKDTLKTLDKLIQESPYEQKEALQNMRKIIAEETNSDVLRNEISELKKAVIYLTGKDMNINLREAEQELTALEGKLGKELISTYREKALEEKAKYPGATISKILKNIVPDDEYDQAILSKGSRAKEKLNAVTNNGSGATSSSATLNVRKTSMKDILTSVLKK